jgi:hypothetical protein
MMSTTAVIARRRLRQVRSGKIVNLTFKKPTRSGRDWACELAFTGRGVSKREIVHGVDALQALLLAVERARQLSRQLGDPLSWVGDDSDPGLPMQVPLMYGAELRHNLEKLIEAEVERFARKMQRSSASARGSKKGKKSTRGPRPRR